jgi:hypothetical protein
MINNELLEQDLGLAAGEAGERTFHLGAPFLILEFWLCKILLFAH